MACLAGSEVNIQQYVKEHIDWNRNAQSGKNQNPERKKNYEYLGILEADVINRDEWKKKERNNPKVQENILQPDVQQKENILQPDVQQKKYILQQDVPLIRYSAPFSKLNKGGTRTDKP